VREDALGLPKGVLARQEWELVQRAQRLEEPALAWLYESYYPRIYSYALLQLGDVQQAEDIASEVMLKVLEALPSYRFRGIPFSAWVFRIARNCLIDHHRRRKRRAEVGLDAAAAAPDKHNPQALAEVAFSRDELRRALLYLTEEQRQVIILKFIHGLDNKSVAKILGRSEGAIKSLQHRALQALRRHLVRGER
jgi:RNA polymerase sigma-70 factor (ECF subfamily)